MNNWYQVTSSNVTAVSKDEFDLLIMFNNNSIYRYFGASSHFDEITKAESVGKYLNKFIKNNYEYNKEN